MVADKAFVVVVHLQPVRTRDFGKLDDHAHHLVCNIGSIKQLAQIVSFETTFVLTWLLGTTEASTCENNLRRAEANRTERGDCVEVGVGKAEEEDKWKEMAAAREKWEGATSGAVLRSINYE